MASLQDRLRRLRESTGNSLAAAPEPGPDTAPAPSLADRVRRLSTARRAVHRAPPATPEDLTENLGAELIAPGLARLERRYSLRQRHGRYRLADCVDAASRPDHGLDGGALQNPAGWTFIDTETSGLAGGTGTWAFLVGVARIDGSELKLQQYLLLQLDAEAALMDRVRTELASTQRLISFNGKSFDLPLLETRLCLNGTRIATTAIPHLDLLYPLRRAFATRWPDCRLATCEQRLLGVERDGDLPGSEAPAAWLEWLRTGQPGRLGAVLRHNRLDLLSLATLIPALVAVQRQPAAYGADIAALARQLCRQHRDRAAEELLERQRNHLEPAARLILAHLKRRRGAWSEAVRIWENLIPVVGDPALLELAKYHEHVRGDHGRALAYAMRLSHNMAHRHRCCRLQRRLQRSGLRSNSVPENTSDWIA